MKVVALLSWYDEPVSQLAATVASLAKLCSHVVAVDGAYALFPDALRKPMSDPEQAETIIRTATALGMGGLMYTPPGPWWGNEVEKRDLMVQLGLAVAQQGDWLLSIDADETLIQAPGDTRSILATAAEDVAAVTMREGEGRFPIRRLFRAQPSLRVEHAHYMLTSNGGVLVDDNGGGVPALALPDVVLEHRPLARPERRQRLKQQFYEDRDRLGVEAVAG